MENGSGRKCVIEEKIEPRVLPRKTRVTEYKEVMAIGSAFDQMLTFLEIEKTDFREFYNLLVLETGETIFCRERPLYLLPLSGRALSPVLRKSGFRVVTFSAKADTQRYALARIRGLDPKKISEFVFVGADQMFYPVLKKAQESGIAVYLVATREIHPEDGSPLLSRVMLDPDFSFVELATYREELRLKPKMERVILRRQKKRAPEIYLKAQRINFSKRIARRETEHSTLAQLLEEYDE